MLIIVFVLWAWHILRNKGNELVLFLCSSPLSYCLKKNSKITLHGFDAQGKPYVFRMLLW